MRRQKMNTVLLCRTCGKETAHELEYVNDAMTRATCLECGETLNRSIDVIEALSKEMIARLLTKPNRLRDELRSQGKWRFMIALPYRVTSKPYRLYRELSENMRVLRSIGRP
ncbi:MAG: hypothetical protein IMW86_04245 [Hydrogenibacillus sp.]|nr:hypothetical protein [Hydrogenibacillus sp.]